MKKRLLFLILCCLLMISCGNQEETVHMIAEPIPEASGGDGETEEENSAFSENIAAENAGSLPAVELDTAYNPPVRGTPGLKTIKNFLATELSLTGHVLYIYGGGWNYEDTGSSEEAVSIGFPKSWTSFFEEQDENFDYKDEEKGYYPEEGLNNYYYAGVDCTGFLGWAVYNTVNTASGGEGFVLKSTDFAKTLSEKGLGSFKVKTVFPAYPASDAVSPGDIVSIDGHAYTVLGTCSDGSVVIIHSSPTKSRAGKAGGGVQLSAVGYREECEAYALAEHYMSAYYPEWFARYEVTLKQPENYFSFSDVGGIFSFNAEGGFDDPENYLKKSAEEILSDLFADDFSLDIHTKNFSETALSQASGFVNLSEAIPGILVEPRYYSEYNFVGRRVKGYEDPVALMSKEAAAALKAVQEDCVPMGYSLKIYDAYRPQRAVQDFVDWSGDKDDRMKAFFYPDIDKSSVFSRGFVSKRSKHSRGSTVDLTLYDTQVGEDLDMGGTFDFFGEQSHYDYKKGMTDEQIANRALLRTLMTKHGFSPISGEWWHFTLSKEPYPNTYFDFPVNAELIKKAGVSGEALAPDNNEENLAADSENADAEEMIVLENNASTAETDAAESKDANGHTADSPLYKATEWLAASPVAANVSQLILVGGTQGSNAEFGLYEKNGAGQWGEVFAVPAYVGKNGLNPNRHQGDKTTPTGIYHFTMAFGIADDPGCPIGYTKVNEYHYWAGNSDSPYYNRFVSILETQDFDPKDSEHLIDYTIPYQYCLNISFNEEQTPDRGAAIFLHCYSKNKYTAGCVAIPNERMKALLQRIRSDCLIIIDTKERLRQTAGGG
ncbi:MAG: L,D-transpeptidase family protein [Lachnospiraceae bacterium]|nr:L,D-transpeptidase family protein [Lachnospiraceae bacterium]